MFFHAVSNMYCTFENGVESFFLLWFMFIYQFAWRKCITFVTPDFYLLALSFTIKHNERSLVFQAKYWGHFQNYYFDLFPRIDLCQVYLHDIFVRLLKQINICTITLEYWLANSLMRGPTGKSFVWRVCYRLLYRSVPWPQNYMMCHKMRTRFFTLLL